MAKTRSRGLQKGGDSSSSRSRLARLATKVKDMKNSNSSGASLNGGLRSGRPSKRNTKTVKSLTVSVSEATGSSNLRGSRRETPTKKPTVKSKNIAGHNTSPSSDKNKLNKAVKKVLQNPPRKSERIENSTPSSFASKRSKKFFTPLIHAKNLKDTRDEKEKLTVQEKSKDPTLDTVNGMLKTRRRLDARSYKALLRGKRPKHSGPAKMHEDDDDAPLICMIETSACDSMEVPKKDKAKTRSGGSTSSMVEPAGGALDGSTSGMAEAAELTIGTDHGSYLANHNINETSTNTNSPNNGVGFPNLKYGGSSLQSSPAGVASKVNNDNVFQRETHECRGVSEASMNEKSSADTDSEISVTPVHGQLPTQERSRANASKKPKQCMRCSEDQRQDCSLAPSRTMHCPVSNDKTQRLEVGDLVKNSEEHSTISKLDKPLMDEPAGVNNACVVCKNPGILLCCDGKGCNRSYHLSCLNLPVQDIPPGVWLCTFCVKKKIQYGIYSVVEGVESLWDVKEGMQNGKHYFVKYKSLAHVHNCWVPEGQLLSEAPELVSKFNWRNQKEKTIRWKKEWTEPQRLLKKRLLMPRKHADEFFHVLGDTFTYCNVEWFVKWRGLGYEHATWELEASPFLCTAEAKLLMKEYEVRHEEARKVSDLSKAIKVKQNSFHKLLRLPDGLPHGLDDDDHLRSINHLRELWHKSQNAVFIDDQERVIKTILFIISLLPDVCRPFLIMSPTVSLSLWEKKFICLTPSINVVIYNGTRDVRKLIRTLEFYNGGDCVMFKVLLTHPDAIIEDLEAIGCIGWEAIIVDECQSLRVSKNLEQLKNLSTGFRLLLLSSPLKDNPAEYINLLSFLDPGETETSSGGTDIGWNECCGMLAILKERLVRCTVYERKPDCSKFSEYWVPACLSDVQLELYCSTLISNIFALRSGSKVDHVGALRDILISLQKCCDHPYLVDQSLQTTLTKNHPIAEILDIGVNASGKLLLLDKILQEIRNCKLRVLILFQSAGGGGRNPIGDILDDFLRQRFGANSYERVGRGLMRSKKQIAMNMFNDTAKGRFIFLIENLACLPSIKLSSLDAIIIYDSDWNPLNDLRALQKLSIESQSDQINILRLYTSSTVEEKVLAFAKQDMNLDGFLKIESLSPNVSHSLLSWGASSLLGRLDGVHQQNNLSECSRLPTWKLFVDEAVQELVGKLWNKAEDCSRRSNSIIADAQLSGAFYSRNITLVGEMEGISSLEGDSSTFWISLLDGRYPQWLYISDPLQRSRRKIQSLGKPAVEDDESKKKQKKIDRVADPITPRGQFQEKRKIAFESEDAVLSKKHAPSGSRQLSATTPWQELVILGGTSIRPELPRDQRNDTLQCQEPSFSAMAGEMPDSIVCPSSVRTDAHKFYTVETDGKAKSRNEQRNHFLLLKPELLQLCRALELPENVKALAVAFLAYILENHQVNLESKAVLQALNMALCWRAASLFKYKVNHKESLAVAEKYLNYQCTEELSVSVYKKLWVLKKKFSHLTGALSKLDWPNSVKNPQQENLIKDLVSGIDSDKATFDHDKVEDSELQESSSCDFNVEQLLSGEQRIGLLKDVLLKKRIDLVNKVYSSREEKTLLRQQQEILEFEQYEEREKMALKSTYHLDLERFQSDKLEQLKLGFMKKLKAFEEHMGRQRKKLEALQLGARVREQRLKDTWLRKAKSAQLDESFDKIPLPDTEFVAEEFKWEDNQVKTSGDVPGNSDMACTPLNEQIELSKTADNPMIASSGGDLLAEPLVSEANTKNQEESAEPLVDVAPTISAEVSCSLSTEAEAPASPTTIEEELTDIEHRTAEPFEAENFPPCSSSPEITFSAADLVDVTQQAGPSNVDMAASIPNLGPALYPAANWPCNPNFFPSAQQILAPPAATASSSGQSNWPASQSIMPPLMTSASNNIAGRFDMICSLLQPFPMPLLSSPQPVDDEPLKNEMMKIRLHEEIMTKKHDDKEFQLRLECEQEIEKIRRKYEALIQDENSSFLKQKKMLGDVRDKVLKNQSLAEEFRTQFIENKGASALSQGRNQSPHMQLFSQASQMYASQRSLAASAAPSVPVPNLVTRSPLALASLVSPPIRAAPPQAIRQAPQVSQNNPVISQFNPMLPLRAGAQAGCEHRAPAPHLHRFRPIALGSAAAGFPHNSNAVLNQQQKLLAGTGPTATARSQAAPTHTHLSSSNVLPGLRGIHSRLTAEGSALLGTLPGPRGNHPGMAAGAGDVLCLSDDD